MQETHATEDVPKIWTSEYGGSMYFSNGENNARGVSILFNKRLNVKVNKVSKDIEGRVLIIDCEINDKLVTLCNIYAPNEDKPDFFIKVFEMLAQHNCSDKVILGDFNLVLEESKDSLNRSANNCKSKDIIKAYMEDMMLVDIWRNLNENAFQFTWFKRKPTDVYARLDMILINYGLCGDVQKVNISPSYRTDHCAVEITLDTYAANKRGPGFWKLNISIFNSAKNIIEMNKIIDESINEYAGYDDCITWEAIKIAL